MKKSIVLVGAHGAGKTTLGRILAERLGVPFHAELGRELAQDPAWRPAGVTAEDAAEAFDTELFARELARDLAWQADPEASDLRVVETWHLGNLAYAEERSPETARAWAQTLWEHCRAQQVVVVWVAVDSDVLQVRQSEEGDGGFFWMVGFRAQTIAREMGLPVVWAINNGDLSPDQVVDVLLAELAMPRQHRPGRRPRLPRLFPHRGA